MQNELLNSLMQHGGPWPYVIIFVFLLGCGFGLPLPEDIFLFVSGLLAYYGVVDIHIITAVCFAGVMIGDMTVFSLGNFYGLRIRKIPWVQKILPPERLKMLQEKLHKQGYKVIFLARFMPGLRTPIFFSAGSLHLPFRVFALFDGVAALISVPTIVYVVYYFGNHVDRVIKIIKRIQFGVFATVIIIVAVVIFKMWWSHKKEREIAGPS